MESGEKMDSVEDYDAEEDDLIEAELVDEDEGILDESAEDIEIAATEGYDLS